MHSIMMTSFSLVLGSCHFHHHPSSFRSPPRFSLQLFRAQRHTPASYHLQGEGALLPHPCHLSPFHWVFLSEGTRRIRSSDCQVYGEANRYVLLYSSPFISVFITYGMQLAYTVGPVFNCENLIIVNCEFFLEFANFCFANLFY